MEFEEIQVEIGDCLEGGKVGEKTITVAVPKSEEGSTSALYREIFSLLGATTAEVCGLKLTIGNLDLCSGVPISSYGDDTGECAVLYFNDSRTSGEGIGRYVNVPSPDLEKIENWAKTDPSWKTGSFYNYSQYYSSRGVKVANYGLTAEIAQTQTRILKSLSRLPESDVYHNAPSRLVPEKKELHLKLKTVVYYSSSTEKGGNQEGERIFKSDKYEKVQG